MNYDGIDKCHSLCLGNRDSDAFDTYPTELQAKSMDQANINVQITAILSDITPSSQPRVRYAYVSPTGLCA